MRLTGRGFSSWLPAVSRGDALGDLPDVQAAGLSPDPQGRAAHGVLISIALLAGGTVRLRDSIDATATGCQSDTMPGNVPLLCLAGVTDTLLCWNGRCVGKQADWRWSVDASAHCFGVVAGFMGLLGHVDELVVRPDIVSAACSHRIRSVGRRLGCPLGRRAFQTPDLRRYFST